MDQRLRLQENNHFPKILSMPETRESLVEGGKIFGLLLEETRNMNHLLPIPHIFVITNKEGAIIDYFGTDSFLQFFERHQIIKGFPLAMKAAGRNAVALSMQSQSLSVVIGTEHGNPVFAKMACLSTPIRIENVIIGFLGLSFDSMHEVTFAIPLIEHLAKSIEEKLPQKDPIIQKMLIYSRFDNYDLTNREKEIAYGWLENKNVPEIADIYGISQSTVRTFIKKIYAKTKVNHKGAFLRKFT